MTDCSSLTAGAQSVFLLPRCSVAISLAASTTQGDVQHQVCSPQPHSAPAAHWAYGGVHGPLWCCVPLPGTGRAAVPPGACLRLATGVADWLEAEGILTSSCYKLGGNSHKASPQLLQCSSPTALLRSSN